MGMDVPDVLVAPNAYKGVLSSLEAARALARGVRKAGGRPVLRPVADGGEGTGALLARALGGWQELVETVDALGRPVRAPVACLPHRCWVVEAASACGLGRLERRDVMAASSFGFGVQLRRVLDWGARQVLVGVGGTAFVDGGAGALAALGVRWLDAKGTVLEPVPRALGRLAAVDTSRLHPRARQVDWLLLVDVRNPLLGPQGAARVYGPQKGARPEDVRVLEDVLERIVRAVQRHGSLDPSLPGLGAGGGLALGFVGLLGARIEPGASFVCRAVGLPEALRHVQVALTGEGRYDGQSGFGKAPFEVARLASQEGVPSLMVAGQVDQDADPGPFCLVVEASGRLPAGRAQAEAELAAAACRALKTWWAAGASLSQPRTPGTQRAAGGLASRMGSGTK